MGWFSKNKEDKQDTSEESSTLPELDFSAIRKKSLEKCTEAGFKPANSLPWIKEATLRPSLEIAGRLHAIKAMVLWLLVPADKLPDQEIIRFMSTNTLSQYMTDEEKSIFEAPRDDEDGRNAIGWKFENAWPLAWFFGHKDLEIHGEMMTGDDMQEILLEHTCKLEGTITEWLENKNTRDQEQVMEQEDVFYCIHNAVRSAQMGKDTVPEGFHPVGNGGVIHERRHALTWMLSKSVSWEETDLST